MQIRRMLLATVLALTACGGAPTNPAIDWVSIRTATPAIGTVLTAGQAVTFTVTVDATLVSANTGVVRLIVTTAGFVPLNQGTIPRQTIAKGASAITLTDTVMIPTESSGSHVIIATPIWVDGVESTAQWAKATYPVL